MIWLLELEPISMIIKFIGFLGLCPLKISYGFLPVDHLRGQKCANSGRGKARLDT